tara:strand:+ start:2490 stop:3851 length:1362 start_codon:yes stop_codon:yes gene_type:complete
MINKKFLVVVTVFLIIIMFVNYVSSSNEGSSPSTSVEEDAVLVSLALEELYTQADIYQKGGIAEFSIQDKGIPEKLVKKVEEEARKQHKWNGGWKGTRIGGLADMQAIVMSTAYGMVMRKEMTEDELLKLGTKMKDTLLGKNPGDFAIDLWEERYNGVRYGYTLSTSNKGATWEVTGRFNKGVAKELGVFIGQIIKDKFSEVDYRKQGKLGIEEAQRLQVEIRSLIDQPSVPDLRHGHQVKQAFIDEGDKKLTLSLINAAAALEGIKMDPTNKDNLLGAEAVGKAGLEVTEEYVNSAVALKGVSEIETTQANIIDMAAFGKQMNIKNNPQALIDAANELIGKAANAVKTYGLSLTQNALNSGVPHDYINRHAKKGKSSYALIDEYKELETLAKSVGMTPKGLEDLANDLDKSYKDTVKDIKDAEAAAQNEGGDGSNNNGGGNGDDDIDDGWRE